MGCLLLPASQNIVDPVYKIGTSDLYRSNIRTTTKFVSTSVLTISKSSFTNQIQAMYINSLTLSPYIPCLTPNVI